MKFRVTGQNKETGARQVVEFEAESRGAAERKALQSGMSVGRVEDISDGEPVKAGVVSGGGARRSNGGRFRGLIILLLIVTVAFALYKLGVIKLPR